MNAPPHLTVRIQDAHPRPVSVHSGTVQLTQPVIHTLAEHLCLSDARKGHLAVFFGLGAEEAIVAIITGEGTIAFQDEAGTLRGCGLPGALHLNWGRCGSRI